MGKILEDPLECEVGDAFPDDGRVSMWGWDIDEDLWASTLYDPLSPEVDPALFGRYFKHVTAVIDGFPVDLAVRVDSENWVRDYPYGWEVIYELAEGH